MACGLQQQPHHTALLGAPVSTFKTCLLAVYCKVLLFCRASVRTKAHTMLPHTHTDMQVLPLYTGALIASCDSCTVHDLSSCTSHQEKVSFAPLSCEDIALEMCSGTQIQVQCRATHLLQAKSTHHALPAITSS